MPFLKLKKLLGSCKIILLSIFSWTIYYFSGFVPRNKALFVIGAAGDLFTDNSKYFFLHAERELKIIWITNSDAIYKLLKSKGYPVEKKYSFKGLLCVIRAGFYIYSHYPSDINFPLSRGAIRINIWHGIPLKHIEYDYDLPDLSKGNKFINLCMVFFGVYTILFNIDNSRLLSFDYILGDDSRYAKQGLTSGFRLQGNQLLTFGLPRRDAGLSGIFTRRTNVDYEFLNKKYYLYIPTYVEENSSSIDLNTIDNILGFNGKVLVYKPHPFESPSVVDKEKALISNLKNIYFLDSAIDVHEILPFTSGVISDCSSILFDCEDMKIPFLVYWPSFKEYVVKRGLYAFAKDFICERVVYDFESFIEFIKREDFDRCSSTRVSASNRSSDDLINFMESIV